MCWPGYGGRSTCIVVNASIHAGVGGKTCTAWGSPLEGMGQLVGLSDADAAGSVGEHHHRAVGQPSGEVSMKLHAPEQHAVVVGVLLRARVVSDGQPVPIAIEG